MNSIQKNNVVFPVKASFIFMLQRQLRMKKHTHTRKALTIHRNASIKCFIISANNGKFTKSLES